jgi:hypothetical protein
MLFCFIFLIRSKNCPWKQCFSPDSFKINNLFGGLHKNEHFCCCLQDMTS